MNFNAVPIRLKNGYLAQVWDESDNIVWESKKVFKSVMKAERTANRKIKSAVENLFADGQS
jgi:hypothetical protein